jgi:hypothetical protein
MAAATQLHKGVPEKIAASLFATNYANTIFSMGSKKTSKD